MVNQRWIAGLVTVLGWWTGLSFSEETEHSNYAAMDDMKEYIKSHFNLTDEAYNEKSNSYYLFYMNDYDKDRRLDGHEIRASLHTTQVANNQKKEQNAEYDSNTEVWSLEQLNEWVDRVLKEDDIDNDGFISLPEYLASQVHHNQSI